MITYIHFLFSYYKPLVVIKKKKNLTWWILLYKYKIFTPGKTANTWIKTESYVWVIIFFLNDFYIQIV